jgi:adenosylcobinamide-phosphate synthase
MSLAIALIIDAILGEPKAVWHRVAHPVVVMGWCISALDRWLNQGDNRRAAGVSALVILVAGGLLIALAIARLPVVGPALEIILAAILIAQRSLVDHLRAVADGLDRGLEQGREAVSHIVGRDPETLDEAGVCRAAIESCAENFSDGVVAPAFWFAIAGLPGILVYKLVNTADSMIGHRTSRHQEFGWAAARLDDLLNLVPARLSGALICLVAGSTKAFRVMLRDAGQHNSPNAGWPEAALAAALGVAIAGPRTYGGVTTESPYMNAEGRRDATGQDIRAAVGVIWQAWGWIVAVAIVLAVLELT